MKKTVVDLNCDMGESYGTWHLGEASDAEIMPLISSANIAAGFHAGDPMVMDRTVALAVDHGVGIGAHPGYRDLQGFGRRQIVASGEEIINDITYQIGALREFARRRGTRLQHVKPHGALYMALAANEELSLSFIQLMRTVAPEAYVYCMSASQTYQLALEGNQPVVREFYADREYDLSGSIVFSRHVFKPDPNQAALRVLRAVQEGVVRTVEGEDMPIEFESICFHSDTPGASAIAAAISSTLLSAGVRIAPPSEFIPPAGQEARRTS